MYLEQQKEEEGRRVLAVSDLAELHTFETPTRFAPPSAFDYAPRCHAAAFLPPSTTRPRTMSNAKARLNDVKDTIAPTPTESTSPTMSVPVDNEIRGKLALVTGASGG